MTPADLERDMNGAETGAGTKTMRESQSRVTPTAGEANGGSVVVAQQTSLRRPSPPRRRDAAEHLPERRRAPRSPRAQLFVTISHWSMVVLLALSLLSGMRIAWSYVESPLGGSTGAWGATLGAVSPRGTLFGINLITYHVVAAFALLLVAGVYVGYLVRSRASRRLQLTGQDLRKLSLGLRAGNFWRNKAALWSANLLVYWAAFFMIVVLGITGVALYRLDWGLSTVLGGYETVRLVHGIVAYLLIPYTIAARDPAVVLRPLLDDLQGAVLPAPPAGRAGEPRHRAAGGRRPVPLERDPRDPDGRAREG